MNKIIFKLPNKLISKYILKHFKELSIDDYFIIVSKGIKIPGNYYELNNTLRTSSKVLNYVLKYDFDSLIYFSNVAFDEDNIEFISNANDNIISKKFILEHLFLLDNVKIRERVIDMYPSLLEVLKEEQVTDEIIKSLEKNIFFIPNREFVSMHPIFLKNTKIMERSIENVPSLILDVPLVTNKMIDICLDKGFVFKKEYFLKNSELQKFDKLIRKVFETDPSMLAFFKELLFYDVDDAIRRGYIPSEEDLIRNPLICNNSKLMSLAVKSQPKLIKYVKSNCYLSNDLVLYALSKYKITKEDLKNNPDICQNDNIMFNLPEYKLYYAYLDYDYKKEGIVNCIKNSLEINDERLPFFDKDFGSKVNSKDIDCLVKMLSLNINSDDIEQQEYYYKILDKIIDGILKIEYEKDKNSFLYPSGIYLRNEIEKTFISVKITNDDNLLNELSKRIFNFASGEISLEDIRTNIKKFYEMYEKTGEFSITSEFCNNILNIHRDNYMSVNKNKKLLSIFSKLDISNKKKKIIMNRKKLHIISLYIKDRNFEVLGITSSDFEQLLINLKLKIQNNKDIKKIGINITDDIFDNIIYIFKNKGYISNEDLVSLGINNKDVSKYIINLFERLKINFISNINLDEKNIDLDEEKKKLGFNYNNFIIADEDRYLDNISELLLSIEEETLKSILNNKKYIHEIKHIISFINLIDELDINTLKNILSQYNRVREKILSTQASILTEDEVKELILNNFDDLINLSNGYSSLDDISLFALGNDVVKKLGEDKVNLHLEFYKNVLKRDSGTIPPIFLKSDDYIFESGIYNDPMRLLIGSTTKLSCISLDNIAGRSTYEEALNGINGDTILVKDSKNNLVSRILLFRRGNVVQLVTNSYDTFSIDIYKEIAKQIIDKSLEVNDNIDYVFVSSFSISNFYDMDTVTDNRFLSKFPHGDFSREAILVGSSYNKKGLKDEMNLDFDCDVKHIYQKQRKNINIEPTDLEITRLRALRIELETDIYLKEELSRNFEVFYSKDYKKVVCGEDWYFAIKKDGTFEEVILPLDNSKSFEELEWLKKQLSGENKGIEVNL